MEKIKNNNKQHHIKYTYIIYKMKRIKGKENKQNKANSAKSNKNPFDTDKKKGMWNKLDGQLV